MSRTLLLIVVLHGLLAASPVQAHYLWVTIDRADGEHGIANIYFEESPSVGDGHYLDPFVQAKTTWIRTVKQISPQLIETSEQTAGEKQRWLSAPLPAAAPRSIESYGKFGVYRYGKTDVLLHYYARYLDVTAHEDLHELARAEQMMLDIVPHDVGDKLELKVLWHGEPAVGRPVFVRGPKRFRVNLETNERGIVRFPVKDRGRYLFRTNVEEDKAGVDGDKEYSSIRHHATLIMTLPLQE